MYFVTRGLDSDSLTGAAVRGRLYAPQLTMSMKVRTRLTFPVQDTCICYIYGTALFALHYYAICPKWFISPICLRYAVCFALRSTIHEPTHDVTYVTV